MTRRPEDQGARAPSGPQEAQTAYGEPRRRGGYQRQSVAEAAIKSLIRSLAGSLGRAIMRAIVGRR
ncbi:MAG: DUF853 family protein [Hyphomonadaceae bacterium]|jgi:hypothetical protein|nr:DUF853 family protein [Hyphomonadaceae bacterium]